MPHVITVAKAERSGKYQRAESTRGAEQDQLNVPQREFVNYSSPSLPSINFTNLSSGVYYLYLKSSTTTCPTRTDAILINGLCIAILMCCQMRKRKPTLITYRSEGRRVCDPRFQHEDKFFKIDS